jgi:uncharacterized protein YdeI (YjbR/CyaY-like superfamily)
LQLPPELQLALAAQPRAQACFEAFPRSARRGILEWIVNARRPETRSRRIAETVRLAADNRRAATWTPRRAD